MLNVIPFPGTTRRLPGLRAVAAVLAGGSAIFLGSALVDQTVRLSDPHYVLRFSSLSVIGVLGCFLTAWLAPRGRAVKVGLTALSFALGVVGAVVVLQSWLPLTVLASVIPAALLVDSVRPR